MVCVLRFQGRITGGIKMDDEGKLKEAIVKLMERDPDAHFTGGVDVNKILQAEKALDVSFPESYKWFLRDYGYGGVTGVEIYGIDLGHPPSVIEYTLDCRRNGLPNSYVVINDVDEWIYCLDTSKMKDGECPVVDWDIRGEGYKEIDNFYYFLIDQFENAIENLI